MKVCGIIAEYNPLHNGHLHHIVESRRITGADYIIVIMGGNFMQRGTPAIMDKYERTRTALSCGADLVIELPAYYSTGSAEYFAMGAVSLLDKLGIVDNLCFGSENGDISVFQKFSQITSQESPEYQNLLQSHLKSGVSYPTARTTAILQLCPELTPFISVLKSPNNILGLEYMKSIYRQHSSIEPVTIRRCGSNYHEIRLGINQSSSSAIRNALLTGIPITDLQNHMPEESYTIFTQYLQKNKALQINDFSQILYYKLLTERHKGFQNYVDVSEALSDRICNNIYQFKNYEDFCDLLKTKEVTYSRISRCLLHILLDMHKDDLDAYINELDITPYARILGFKKSSTPLLSQINKTTRIPLITKLADAKDILTEEAYSMLQKEIQINDIYSAMQALQSNRPMANEYSTPIVII